MLRSNLYGSLAVLAVVAAIAVGLPGLDRALPTRRTVAAGQRIEVGRGVSVMAPPGAVLDLPGTAPSDHRVALTVHGVRVVIEVTAYQGSLPGLSDRFRRDIRGDPGYRTSRHEHLLRTAAGVAGLRGSYATPGRIGSYLVFAHDGVGVEVSFAGTGTDLRHRDDALLAMVRSIRFGTS